MLPGSAGSSRTSWWRGQQNVPLLWPPRCVESRCFPPPGGFQLRGKTVKWDFGSFWGCFLVMPKRRHMKGHGRWRVSGVLVYQTMGSLQKLTLGIDVAKNHAIMLCCQAVMAPAGPVGGEASKMSPFCGRPGVWKAGVFPPPGGFPLRGKTVK